MDVSIIALGDVWKKGLQVAGFKKGLEMLQRTYQERRQSLIFKYVLKNSLGDAFKRVL